MATPSIPARERAVEVSTAELAGAIGDSVTVLPIVVAVATLTPLSLAPLLLGFAVFQVVWGLYYGVPLSVEPMKALAALVIAGGLSVSGFALAGLLAGVALLVLGTAGALSRVRSAIGTPAIRGVQLAVALLLLETGVRLGIGNPWLAAGGAGVAALAVAAGYRRASAMVVLVVGIGVAGVSTGLPSPALPSVRVGLGFGGAADPTATVQAAGAQLAMTVGNAAVATSLLLEEFYGADVSADELATSMGAMTLVAVPLGGMPMCHGSGGVAGKYAFGARTAGANLLLGVLYAVAALVAVDLVVAFPMAVLGVVLALVAVELGRAGLDSEHRPLTVGVGLLGVVAGVGVAFVAGAVAWAALERYRDDPTGRESAAD